MKNTLAIVLLVMVFAGCSTEKYGAALSKDAQSMKVKNIILSPNLQGSKVMVEGEISIQCMSSGCWFFLTDDTGRLYIDLVPKGFAIPPSIGKKARVTGTVVQSQDGYMVVADGVEVR